MADPRLEQERILPRLQRILDVVSSWAEPPPGAHAPNLEDEEAAEARSTRKNAAAVATGADAASGPSAGASPALPGKPERDGDPDTDRAHGGAAGTGRRHARDTEPIWHLVGGQDASPRPGLPTAQPHAPGPDQGAPASAPGRHAGHSGESIATAVGIVPVSGSSRARTSPGTGAAMTGASSTATDADAMSDHDDGPDAAASAPDAVVLQPLLDQETPPLFGRAATSGRKPTASDTGARASQAPGASDAPGSAPGSTPAPRRATTQGAEPTPGHSSSRAGTAPGSLLQPPDLLGAGERGPAWPEPRAVPADAQPAAATSAEGPVDRDVDRGFGRSELEEEVADVLERAALEAGVDLS